MHREITALWARPKTERWWILETDARPTQPTLIPVNASQSVSVDHLRIPAVDQTILFWP